MASQLAYNYARTITYAVLRANQSARNSMTVLLQRSDTPRYRARVLTPTTFANGSHESEFLESGWSKRGAGGARPMHSQERLRVATHRSSVCSHSRQSAELEPDRRGPMPHGFAAVVCPSCDGVSHLDGTACSNCEGDGRLWAHRGATLSDNGLRRFLSMKP